MKNNFSKIYREQKEEMSQRAISKTLSYRMQRTSAKEFPKNYNDIFECKTNQWSSLENQKITERM